MATTNRLRFFPPVPLPATNGNGKHHAPATEVKALDPASAAYATSAVFHPESSFWFMEGGPDDTTREAPDRLAGARAYMLADLAYAAISYRARKLSEPPLMVVQETDEGEEWQKGHELAALLETPNDDQSMEELVEQSSILADTTGMCLWVKDADGVGRPARLVAFGAEEFTVRPKDGRIYGEFEIQAAQGPKKLGPDEVVFFRFPHPSDRWKGFAPLDAAAAKLGLGQALVTAVRQGLKRNARPGASATTDQEVPDDRYEEIRDRLSTHVEGIRNNGRTFFGTHGLSLEFHDHDMNKLAAGALAREVEAAVCMCFGTRPEVLGALVGLENAPWSHMRDARKITYHDAVQPLRRRWESVLTRQLLRPVDSDHSMLIRFDTSQVAELQDDHESKARISQLNADIWSVDERRLYTGKEPRGGVEGAAIVGQRQNPGQLQGEAQGGEKGRESKAFDQGQIRWALFDASARAEEFEWLLAAAEQLEKDRAAVLRIVNAEKSGAAPRERKDDDPFGPVDADLIRRLYERIGKALDARNPERLAAFRSLTTRTGRAAVERMAAEIGVSFDLLQPGLIEYVQREAAWLVTQITDTTKQGIRDALGAGLVEGESIPKLTERIRESGTFARSRAELIARTETTRVTNGAQRDSLEVYSRDSGNKINKSWLTARDDRVRDEHAAMDGETRGIDEAFSNGLLAPGEPNCRCTLTYAMEAA